MFRRSIALLASATLLFGVMLGAAHPATASTGTADLTEGDGLAAWSYRDEPGSGTAGWGTNTVHYSDWDLEPTSGSTYFAYGDQVLPSAGVLYRTFTLDPSGPLEIGFSYYLASMAPLAVYDNMATNGCFEGGCGEENQQFRVDILSAAPSNWFGDPTVNLLENILSPRVEGPLDGWNDVTVDVSAYSGQTIVLAFREVDNLAPLNVAIDNIRVPGVSPTCALAATVCPTITAAGSTQVVAAPGTRYTAAYATYTWSRCGQPGDALISSKPPVTCRKISSFKGNAAQMALRPYTVTAQDVRAGYLRLAVKVLNTTYYSVAYATTR